MSGRIFKFGGAIMIYLKEVCREDAAKEYEFIRSVPYEEHSFINEFLSDSFEEFESCRLKSMIDSAEGIGLPEGYVPETNLMLWDDDEIVGWFRIRHYLCPSLVEGSGHIGYTIAKEHRGKGYGTQGLRLAVEKAKKIIPEDEIYLRVDKDNRASLRIMQKNGGYIHHEDEKKYYVRIKL